MVHLGGGWGGVWCGVVFGGVWLGGCSTHAENDKHGCLHDGDDLLFPNMFI